MGKNPFKFLLLLAGAAPALAAPGAGSPSLPPTRGPLTIHPDNPRWFADADGRAVYLVGSHTWANFQEIRRAGDPSFDHDAWLAFLAEHRFNFQRLWIWEHAAWATWTKEKLLIDPLPSMAARNSTSTGSTRPFSTACAPA